MIDSNKKISRLGSRSQRGLDHLGMLEHGVWTLYCSKCYRCQSLGVNSRKIDIRKTCSWPHADNSCATSKCTFWPNCQVLRPHIAMGMELRLLRMPHASLTQYQCKSGRFQFPSLGRRARRYFCRPAGEESNAIPLKTGE